MEEGLEGGKRDEGRDKKEVNARARTHVRTKGTEYSILPVVASKYSGVGDATVLQYIETGRQQTNHAPATNLPGSNSCRFAAYAKPPGLYSEREYICPRIPDRGFDPPWTHAGIFDRPWPSSRALIRLASHFFSFFFFL